jgi:hypothetical protein
VYVSGTSANDDDEAAEPVIVSEDEASTRYEGAADGWLDATLVPGGATQCVQIVEV